MFFFGIILSLKSAVNFLADITETGFNYITTVNELQNCIYANFLKLLSFIFQFSLSLSLHPFFFLVVLRFEFRTSHL
jgi:hypothetical protein